MVMPEGIQEKCKGALKESGCYFIDLLEWALRLTGTQSFNEKQALEFIETQFERGLKAKNVREDCYVVTPVNVMFQVQGARQVIPYGATIKHSTGVFPTQDNPKGCPNEKVFIIRLEKPMYAHFVLCDNGVIWDSLDPNRPAAKSYKRASYRVLG